MCLYVLVGTEVDALRPKSPMRGGGSGGGGAGTGVGANSTNMQAGGMVISSGGMLNHHHRGVGASTMIRGHGNEQANMLDMGGGMGNMGCMGMNPHAHHPLGVGVGMGLGMGVGMGAMGMGVGMGWPAPGVAPPMGMPMGMGMGMGMTAMGMVAAGRGFDGSGGGGGGGAGMQMQVPMQGPGGQFHTYMDDGMWDAGGDGGMARMSDHEAEGLANIGGGGMSGMGMGNM